MNQIHPDWLETQNEETCVPVRLAAKEEPNQIKNKDFAMPVSRSPAAVFGILLAASLGLTSVFGVSRLTGEVAGGPPLIHISDGGAKPAAVSAALGDTVRWINDQDTAHIIKSDDLCTSGGKCLYTETIFPGEETDFEVPMDLAPGTYSYSSVTNAGITGKITVTSQVAIITKNSAASSPMQIVSAPEPNSSEQPARIPVNLPDSYSSDPYPEPEPYAPHQEIPTNPNAGSLSAGYVQNTSAQSQPQVSAHKPFAQPQTGSQTALLALIASTGMLVYLTWNIKHET